jgi:hypothetical protein
VNADLAEAQRKLPMPRLLVEHGHAESGSPCPVCKGIAEITRTGDFSAAWLERLKGSFDLVREIEATGVVFKKSGRSRVAKECPKCRGGGFNVDPVKQLFHCFGCSSDSDKFAGDVFAWTRFARNCGFREAVEQLASAVKLEPEFESGARHWFRCANADCATRQKLRGDTELRERLDEVGLVQVLHGLTRNEAFASYLQMAGQGGPRKLPSSTLPGAPKRRTKVPQEKAPSLSHPSPGAATATPAEPASEPPPLMVPPVSAGGASPTQGDLPADAGGGDLLSPETPNLKDPAITHVSMAEVLEINAKQVEPAKAAEVPPSPAAQVVNEEELPLNAVREFYSRLIWRDHDRERTFVKRGICASVQRLFGLRSGVRENEALLIALADKFPMGALEKAGLWVKVRSGESRGRRPVTVREGCQPNPQFFGLRLGSTKDDTGKRRFEWAPEGEEPVLIPYFDWADHAVAEEGAEPAKDAGKAAKIVELVRRAIITEGEFKAIALWQVFCLGSRWLRADSWEPPVDKLMALRPHKGGSKGVASRFYTTPAFGGCAVGAVPGVTFAKRDLDASKTGGYAVRVALEAWLKALGVRHATIAYDLEEKRDRARFPGVFKDDFDGDPFRGYAALVWGLYLGRELEKRGLEITYWNLPSGYAPGEPDWRDEHGKADFDGALARELRQAA